MIKYSVCDFGSHLVVSLWHFSKKKNTQLSRNTVVQVLNYTAVCKLHVCGLVNFFAVAQKQSL